MSGATSSCCSAAGQARSLLIFRYYKGQNSSSWINLKIARALGLNVPPTVLARADEVIE